MEIFFSPLVIAAMMFLLFVGIYRARTGFGFGKTVSRDNVLLVSERYGLSGKPDRIVYKGGKYIPEDLKPKARIYNTHRVQMGVYLLLVEEYFKVKPTHGVIVLKGGRRVKIENTDVLQSEVLDIVGWIRESREDIGTPLKAIGTVGKCRGCSQRENCGQRAD